MQEVVKKEIVKLLDTGIIYPIANSPWVSPIHCVPKKGGISVVKNEKDELVLTRTVTGWRVCIDYLKLNEATAKDQCPLPFIDQLCMLAIFHEMIEESVKVFMDDFSVFGNSFDSCLNNLDKMLQCTENVAADHLSRIENDETSDDSEVDDNFPGETLMEITTRDIPWFADFANYLVVRITKVIKGEFEKIKDVKVEDVSLTCDTPLEVFNNEVNRLSRMDDDLFTYEVEVANIQFDSKIDDDSEHEADDDMGYDPSDVAFTEWLGSKNFNYKTMDHYTKKALWIYWIRGDDEVELTDEESSDDKDEVAEVFRIDTNLFNFETPMCKAFKEFNYLLQVDPDLLTKDIEGFKTYEDYKDDWIYKWNKDVAWVDEKPWTNIGVWTKPTPVKHTCKPFNYKTGCSE
ncbi:hypothetical protein Tco_0019557 [Tanacetum coccineum]